MTDVRYEFDTGFNYTAGNLVANPNQIVARLQGIVMDPSKRANSSGWLRRIDRSQAKPRWSQ